MPHPAAVPVPLVAGVVVALGPFGKIQERSRVAIEHRFDMPQRFQIADSADARAKWLQRFSRDLAQAELPAVAQFPDRCVDVAGEWIARERLLRHAPAPARRMF